MSNNVRLHRNLVEACISGLQQIFSEGKYSDSVIKNILKSNPKWGSSDRKFIAETIYDTVRWWRKLWFIAGEEPSFERAGLWKVLGVYFLSNEIMLSSWDEWEGLGNLSLSEKLNEANGIRVLRESIPDWLDNSAYKELGDIWDKELSELNKPAPFVIRLNTLKTSLKDLQLELKNEGVETAPVSAHPDALIIDVRRNIFTTQCFKNGLFEVQDASSQEVACFMDVAPGMRVIDACAGGGGKSLHIGALMQNKGRIISLDIFGWKLEELRKRAKRGSVSIIETRTIDSSKVTKRLENSADRVLIDAPCSGLGVLRRSPDIKWKLTPESLDRIREEQFNILSKYSAMTKLKGNLIYATCSILPSENEQIVNQFLAENTGFKKVKEKVMMPSVSGFDGFYMAMMQKVG